MYSTRMTVRLNTLSKAPLFCSYGQIGTDAHTQEPEEEKGPSELMQAGINLFRV
jgi:hypothetical protein